DEPRPEPDEPDADETPTGTFVSRLRQHMSAVEERLFPGSSGAALDDGAPPDIDLDSIGMTSAGPPAPDLDGDEARPAPVEAPRPPPPAGGRRPPVTGGLAEEDVASLLGRLAREAWTGRVTFKLADVVKTVLFDDGRPVFATSTLSHDRMGELLVREGKITRD